MFPIRDTQPSYSKPVITVLLIAVNILIFLFEFSLDPYTLNAFIAHYGLVPDRLRLSGIFTSMFLHSGWMHVLGNMWFLWIFGDNIEDIMGHSKFLLFYLLCGVVAAMTQVLFNPYSRIPMVGASGAIAGVMGAYMIKFPRARIQSLVTLVFFFFFTEIPAWVMLIYWFFIQFINGVGSIAQTQYSQMGGTAFLAHVGGFLAGMLLVGMLGTRQRYYRRRDLYW
jgi:membrane associated rhomboid family serine protease